MINEILSEALLPILVVLFAYYVSTKPMDKSEEEINEVNNPYYKGRT